MKENRHEAGYPTPWDLSSAAPLSPEATVTVMPSAAADCSTWSNSVWKLASTEDSGPPQLIEMTEGSLALSCTAWERASRKSRSVAPGVK